MINTAFPNKILDKYNIDYYNYILPLDLQNTISNQNHDLLNTRELRLQKIYTDEVWMKIKSISLDNFNWKDKDVLDVASGNGFLSYHLLQRVNPKKIVLSDISPSAINESKELINSNFKDVLVEFKEFDVLKSDLTDASFDVIIGNSFIHHFYDIPEAFKEFYRLLKPGGIFVSLHEPTPAAAAVESGNFLRMFWWLIRGKKYISDVRKIKGDFSLDDNIGGDVWLLEKNDMIRLLKEAGFDSVKISFWNIFRSFFVALFNMHLNEQKKSLNKIQIYLLKLGIAMDYFLSKFLPTSSFGSISICAKK
jgi:Methylase involved in ubiquinone/menaquinone biosynthesis